VGVVIMEVIPIPSPSVRLKQDDELNETFIGLPEISTTIKQNFRI